MFRWTKEIYEALVEERKAQNRPLPPAEHIKHAGHHWLAYRDPNSGGGRTMSLMVAQWSPTLQEWYHSNELATDARSLGELVHWEWVTHIPVPELDK